MGFSSLNSGIIYRLVCNLTLSMVWYQPIVITKGSFEPVFRVTQEQMCFEVGETKIMNFRLG